MAYTSPRSSGTHALTVMILTKLVERLIKIPSLTGKEKRVAEFLDSYLRSKGFRVTMQEVVTDPSPLGIKSREGKRFNVIAKFDAPRIFFVTHLDTVPPFIRFSEDNGYIYGRGACDAKGIIAAMVKAGEKLADDGIYDFGYLFTVGEETDSAGAKAALQLGLKADYLVVGEPTDNKLALGHKGNLTFTLKTTGKAAHSAYPELGDSAIENILVIIDQIKKEPFGKDDLLGATTMNIGVLEGGTKPNVIADHALAKIMLRIVTPAASVEQRIREIVSDKAEIEIVSRVDPQRMLQFEGFETTVVAFGTDIHYLRQIGKPLLIGPGSILDAHGPSEKISKQELHEAVDVYYRLAKKLIAGSGF